MTAPHAGKRTPQRKARARAAGQARTRAALAGGLVYKAGVLKEAILEEARRNGLFEGEKSEHISFRAPLALLEAAKRETGIMSNSELGTLALALLAQPDPVVAFMKRTRGRLGKGHKLDY